MTKVSVPVGVRGSVVEQKPGLVNAFPTVILVSGLEDGAGEDCIVFGQPFLTFQSGGKGCPGQEDTRGISGPLKSKIRMQNINQ